MKKLLAVLLFMVAASSRAQIIDFAYHLTASTYPLANSGSGSSSVGPYSGTPVLGDLLWFNGTNWVSLNKPADGTYSIKFLASTPSYIAAGGSTPTGTGFTHITAGVQDGAAKLVDTADINANQVTLAKLATQAANTFLVNATSGAAVPTAATAQLAAQVLAVDTSYVYWREDFFGLCGSQGACGPFRGTFTGAGANTFTLDGGTAHTGVADFQTGTTTTGAMSYLAQDSAATNGTVRLGGGAIVAKWAVQIPTLSDGTNTYIARVGFQKGPNIVTSKLTVEYDQTNDTHWRVCATNNGTGPTCGNTSNTVTAGQWDTIEMDVNAAGTSVAVLINGSAVTGSPFSTNLPTVVGVAPSVEIIKSAGTTSRSLYIDYYIFFQAMTAAR
jgi:hypothetical protein